MGYKAVLVSVKEVVPAATLWRTCSTSSVIQLIYSFTTKLLCGGEIRSPIHPSYELVEGMQVLGGETRSHFSLPVGTLHMGWKTTLPPVVND